MKNQQYALSGKLIYLLILVTIVQTIYPITGIGRGASGEDSLFWLIIYQMLYGTLMVAGIVVARDNPVYTRILIGLGCLWLLAGGVYAVNQQQSWALLLAFATIAVFQAMVTFVLIRFIFITDRVDRDVIYAACTIYLLLGGIFGVVFGIVETVTFASTGGMHAFEDGLSGPGEIVTWQTLLYYSYATLTTLGYGDILPVTMWARSLATLEAIVGVLYITIIMARLVGLYAGQEVETEVLKDRTPLDL